MLFNDKEDCARVAILFIRRREEAADRWERRAGASRAGEPGLNWAAEWADGPFMRALSIRQPYAELILIWIKTIYYRSRRTLIIGERFYIYASRTPGPAAAGVRSCAAFRNSQADPRNSATKKPFRSKISLTELTGLWCFPAISGQP